MLAASSPCATTWSIKSGSIFTSSLIDTIQLSCSSKLVVRNTCFPYAKHYSAQTLLQIAEHLPTTVEYLHKTTTLATKALLCERHVCRYRWYQQFIVRLNGEIKAILPRNIRHQDCMTPFVRQVILKLANLPAHMEDWPISTAIKCCTASFLVFFGGSEAAGGSSCGDSMQHLHNLACSCSTPSLSTILQTQRLSVHHQ